MSSARQLLTAASRPTPVKDPTTGTLTAWFESQQHDVMVYRLTVQGPASSIARVHVGVSANIGTYRSISYFGQQDDADYPAGLLVPMGSQLFVAWYDVTAPATIAAPVPITTAGSIGVATADVELLA